MESPKTKETYNAGEKETYWQKFWEEAGVNKFNPDSSKELFTIDTPPPTISGALHLGHVYSYSQAEVIARYRRLAGFNVRYPMGFDNNGLPTERLVEKEKKIQGHNLPLAEFVKICLEVTDQYKEKYSQLWKSLGLSIDWDLEYSTISPESQKLAQTVFKELFEKEAIYQKEATALYCHRCRTSVAQAEVEDQERDSVFYDVAFTKKDGGNLIISTTRPELLPACVAVFVHPDDQRYTDIVGKIAITPFGQNIPVLADDKVSIEKGTGAVMCCTYGDETDVYWVREHKLPERIILAKNGKFLELAELPGISLKSIEEARKIVVVKLKELGAITSERSIKHSVGVHERCGTPIELLPTKQWFVKMLDRKEDLLEAGRKIKWHPSFMVKRYEQWVSGLKWDWCISRERFFGVPIPAYTCDSCDHILIPDENQFPIDPKIQTKNLPCPKCQKGNLIPEKGVLDTWFTSALTPNINNNFPANSQLIGKLYPMSMRPQGHDIIRTWAVYSILMGLYRHQDIPWKELMISGHILLKKGEKISKKTGGGQFKPEDVIKTHSADAIRYAMYGASLGRDAFYDEREVKKGKKLVIKLYNAGKFILGHLLNFSQENAADKPELEALDRWIINKSYTVAQKMAQEFEKYEYNKARLIFEDFFWSDFCDNYLEIIKGRLWNEEKSSEKYRSAQYALYHAYLNILKMISPFVPHITEEMYHAELSADGKTTSQKESGFLAIREGQKSIHLTNWPSNNQKISLTKEESLGAELMLTTIAEARKYRAFKQLATNVIMPSFTVDGENNQESLLKPFITDLLFVIKAEKIVFQTKKR